MSSIMVGLAGQNGDIMTAMSVLKYREELWGDSKIVWFAEDRNFDLLRYQPNLEVREFPRGYGYPEMVKVENQKLINEGKEPVWQDWQPLVDVNNFMNLELQHNYPSLKEFVKGYFPAPHQVPLDKRRNVPYPLVSKIVFGIPDECEWHPLLYFSEQEKDMANYFVDSIGEGKIICVESFAGSGQSLIDAITIVDAMDICRREFGECKFILVSHKFINGNEAFPEGLINNVDIFSAAHFTVRQCALIVGKSDLLISVSSGISVAASCWGNHATPIIQFTGSYICSTQDLALGRFELVTTDGKSLRTAVLEFKDRLSLLLKNIK